MISCSSGFELASFSLTKQLWHYYCTTLLNRLNILDNIQSQPSQNNGSVCSNAEYLEWTSVCSNAEYLEWTVHTLIRLIAF